jgi:ubiquinone/menaquinone biosynthesis C-methylase UbiE
VNRITALRNAAESEVRIDPTRLPAELKARHGVRFPGLDANSHQDFARGFKSWLSADWQKPEALKTRELALTARGFPPGATTLDYVECFAVLMQDPVFAARTRLQWSIHDFMWDRAMRAFHLESDAFLRAMEETDRSGPGTLTLRPDIAMPDYVRHEIHRQPGGFVGDPFAGWVYHYALTLAHYGGRSDHDEIFFQIAQSHPLPADGKVSRILDIGCGPGQCTTAFRQRFPRAEVWGLDIGGPMVRYAHHRAVKLGIEVHFTQDLAESMPFPDGHFDLVSDYIMFHETNRDAMRKIVKEVYRVLRPGGVFGHLDAFTAGHPTRPPPDDLQGKAMLWNIYRNNYEPFYLDYSELDFPSVLREAGFQVDLEGPPVLWNGRPRTLATKPP